MTSVWTKSAWNLGTRDRSGAARIEIKVAKFAQKSPKIGLKNVLLDKNRRLVFSTITGKMNLSEDVDLEDFVARPDKISGADIHSICQEAGMIAVRENRYVVLAKDFEKAYKNQLKNKDEMEHEFYH